VLASLLGFAVIYGVLAVVWLRLVRHISRQPLAPLPAAAPATELAPAY
jgi:cytochrome d ubiquinol oxidase subunit I